MGVSRLLGHPSVIFAPRIAKVGRLCLGKISIIKLNYLSVMEFKFRANIVMSRELTVETDHLSDALDKVREIMAKPG